MVLRAEALAKRRPLGLEGLQPPWVVSRESLGAAEEPQAGPLLRARLAQQEGTRLEIEGREAVPSRKGGFGLSPVEATRDHQVQDEEEFILQLEDDALAHAAQSDDAPALRLLDARVMASEDEGAADANAPDLLSLHAAPQRVEIEFFRFSGSGCSR